MFGPGDLKPVDRLTPTAGFDYADDRNVSRPTLSAEGGIKGQFSKVAFNAAVFKQQITGFQGNVFSGTGFIWRTCLGNRPSASSSTAA